jgi:hypothetical protein
MTHQPGLARGRTPMAAIASVASLAMAGLAAGTSYAHASGPGADRQAPHRSERAALRHRQPDAYVDVTAGDAGTVASSA